MLHHPVVGAGKPKTCKCGVTNPKARNCCRNTPGQCVLLWDHELRGIVLGSRAVRAALNQARCLRHQDSWDHENANLRFQAYKPAVYLRDHRYHRKRKSSAYTRMCMLGDSRPLAGSQLRWIQGGFRERHAAS